jgi:hypothetical protein
MANDAGDRVGISIDRFNSEIQHPGLQVHGPSQLRSCGGATLSLKNSMSIGDQSPDTSLSYTCSLAI